MICLGWAAVGSAAVLTSQNFEGQTGLPVGWTVYDPDSSGNFSIVTGHNGAGGGSGLGGRWTSGSGTNPGSIAGGFIKAPATAVTSQAVTVSFDLQSVASSSSTDDAVFVMGNLSEPYNENASATTRYLMVVLNETAASCEVFLVTNGARAQIGSDLPAFTAGVWRRFSATWTPTSGTQGTLSFTVTTASSGATVASFTTPSAVDLGSSLSFGFGSYNDSTVFDNIVINGSDANSLTAMGDAIQVGVGGAISFDPTANDIGGFLPGSVTIVTPPGQGTATFNAATGKVVYRHTGAAAGNDTFRYQISSASGGAAQANVSVNVSSALRLANTTLNLPADPPPGGALQLIDALPGLTFDGIVALASVPGATKKLIVASAHGVNTGSDSKVWIVPDTTVAAPVKKELFEVDSLCPTPFTRGRGIYGLTLHPEFAANGHIFICYQGLPQFQAPTNQIPNLFKNGAPYTTINCSLRVSRFTVTPAQLATLETSTNATELANTRAAIVASELRLINLAEQDLFHSINDCQFGPDGYLYVSFGDEGDQGEPYRNAQYITKDQYSSILRLDVDRKPGPETIEPNPHYAIVVNPSTGLANFKVPADNPFVGNSVTFNGTTYTPAHPDFARIRTEIWSTGWRNPFKFHIDPPTGDVWVGDVGRDLWEEVTVARSGDNAGWSWWEGSHLTNIAHAVSPTTHKLPEYDYAHSSGNNCVIGGVFYRGAQYSGLTNKYIFGDHGSGRLWSLTRSTPGNAIVRDLGVGTVGQVVDFHIDPHTDEILIAQYQVSKKIYRLREGAPPTSTFPTLLSQTGAFADLATLEPNPGVVPYTPNLKFWSDHADKLRWFGLKNTVDQFGYSRDGNWTFPVGSVFVKHFDMELNRDFPGTNRRRLETRFLVRNAAGIYGVSYRWNDEQTDATLVSTTGVDFDLPVRHGGTLSAGVVTGGNVVTQKWHIPSRGECLTCHNPNAGHMLSPNTRQLNKPGSLAGANGNFLTLLSQAGYLAGFNDNPAALERFHRPDETAVSLDHRVRSYLAVNCSYCHQPNSGVVETWDARGHLSIEQMRLLYNRPLSESYHDEDDNIITPGSQANSLILNRIHARNDIGDGTYNGYSQMPPIATSELDLQGIALLTAWVENCANVAPTISAPSAASVSESAAPGAVVAAIGANDPDVRAAGADNSAITFAITAGNANGLFSIDPATGQLVVNSLLDFEAGAQHVLQIAASDHFGPNPKTTTHTLTIHLQNVANEDANGNGLPDWWESAAGSGPFSYAGDQDRDGIPDFFEFVGGRHPALAEANGSTPLEAVDHLPGPQGGVVLRWRHRHGLVFGIDYFLEGAPSLSPAAWTPLELPHYEFLSVTPDGPGFSIYTIRIPPTGDASFYRLSSP